MRKLPHVVSIPPGARFLPTLVDDLLNGRLIEGYAPKSDRLALSRASIWVPTRRAVRALASEFAARMEGDVALLPNIQALGDVDEDDLFFDGALDGGLEPVMGSMERHIILSRLVAAWADGLKPQQREAFYDGGDIIMPSSFADAVWFAGDLANLMDTVATEEADWAKLETLVPDGYAEWWQLTLEFLTIATKSWPHILAERGLQDAASLRAKMLRVQAKAYETNPDCGPVIAAGSTGSIPATADLLKTIAHLPQGTVVLPGLDRDLDNETWRKIDLPDNDVDEDGTAPGQPQYGLKKLIHHIGLDRSNDDIRHIGDVDGLSSGFARVREMLVSEALRPSFSTGAWQHVFEKTSVEQRQSALAGVSLVEASGEREEALAIALALRDCVEDKQKSAALVTPDRNLARRVAVEMRRFGVDLDDSAGQPLRNRPAGTFFRMVLKVVFGPSDPVALVTLLKHPLACFGATPQRARRAARLFELAVLRGAIVPPQAGGFHADVSALRQQATAKTGRVPRSVGRYSPTDWEDLSWLVMTLDDVLLPITTTEATLADWAKQTVRHLEVMAAHETEGLNRLYGSEDGKALQGFLTDLLDDRSGVIAAADEWPDIAMALMGERAVRPLVGQHPRISILGPLEARLQTYDRVVLGGLNEKTWPASARNDPFLSRPMKSALGLPPPERRTGLAAHDFQMLMGIEDVVLTRSTKSDNAPTVASRWVQRLCMVAGEDVATSMRKRGRAFTDWAKQIDEPSGTSKAWPQPRPKPPLAVRPNRLSITEIETWIADPYAIYARHILKLDALQPLLRDADARERGTLYHTIMERFVREVKDPNSDTALQDLLDIARIEFDCTHVPPEQTAMWWPRFQTIAASFLRWHKEYVKGVQQIYVELKGRSDHDLDGFILSGRVDRIDVMLDGSFNLYDYKTGLNPKVSHVESLNAPQLPISAAMAMHGAFEDVKPTTPSQLGYIRLRPDPELIVDTVGKRAKKPDANQLAVDAWEDLKGLIEAYRDGDRDYRSKARIITDTDFESDYDHLARVAEWSVAGEEDDDDFEAAS